MRRFRRIIFWTHLIAGVVAAIVILIMSVTGVLLAFEHQMISYAERNMTTVSQVPSDRVRLTIDALLLRAASAKPALKPSGITLQSNPASAATVIFGRDGVLYLNPYTGDVLGAGASRTRGFFRIVEDAHRWLAFGESNRATGRAITGAANVAFLILAISGVYLWWPRKTTWQKIKSAALFHRGLKNRVRYFNWHTVTGFWISSILIVLTATGIVMSYQWANNLLYRVTGSELPTQQRPGIPATSGNDRSLQQKPAGKGTSDLQRLWSRAEQQSESWRSITLRLPVPPNTPVTFNIREGKSWLEAASSQLTLKPDTTEVLKWEPYSRSSAGRQARTWVRFLHTGEAGGVLGQLVAGVASLGGSFLVWTGLMLAWKRLGAWRRRRSSRSESEIEIVIFEPRPTKKREVIN